MMTRSQPGHRGSPARLAAPPRHTAVARPASQVLAVRRFARVSQRHRGYEEGVEWVVSHAVAIGSALVAALAAAIGIVVRQVALQRAAVDDDEPVGIVEGVLRDRLWWAGT